MNPIRDVPYFALDLELNNLNNGQVPKIIQVGIAIGTPNQIKTYSWLVNPQEPLVSFITQLTGITEDMIATQSVTLDVVARELGELLSNEKPFVNPVTWGGGDADELKTEFQQNGIQFPFFGRRIIDVKTIYVFLEQVNGRSPSGGLRKSMGRYGLQFQGTPHNAEFDALNTLRFFFFLRERQRKLEEVIQSMKTISY